MVRLIEQATNDLLVVRILLENDDYCDERILHVHSQVVLVSNRVHLSLLFRYYDGDYYWNCGLLEMDCRNYPNVCRGDKLRKRCDKNKGHDCGRNRTLILHEHLNIKIHSLIQIEKKRCFSEPLTCGSAP